MGIQRAVTVAVRQGAVVDHYMIAITGVDAVGTHHCAAVHRQHRRALGGAIIRPAVIV